MAQANPEASIGGVERRGVMKIGKAIELLDVAKEGWPFNDEEYYKALKLGIEALKVIQKLRPGSSYWREMRLPGETKE